MYKLFRLWDECYDQSFWRRGWNIKRIMKYDRGQTECLIGNFNGIHHSLGILLVICGSNWVGVGDCNYDLEKEHRKNDDSQEEKEKNEQTLFLPLPPPALLPFHTLHTLFANIVRGAFDFSAQTRFSMCACFLASQSKRNWNYQSTLFDQGESGSTFRPLCSHPPPPSK